MSRMVGAVVLVAVAALAVAGAWLAVGGKDGEAAVSERQDIPIATLIYLDSGFDPENAYEPTGGLGTWRWNYYGGDPESEKGQFFFTGFVSTWPEIGFYASQARETIDWQLDQMERAGINTVVLSWSGWGDVNLDGVIDEADAGRIPSHINDTARMFLDEMVESKPRFRFSFLVEDFPNHEGFGGVRNLSNGQREMVLNYLQENYFGEGTKYGHRSLILNQKPVIFGTSVREDNSSHSTELPNAWWGRNDFSDARFELIDIAEFAGIEDQMTSVYVYQNPPSAVPGKHGIVTIWPRFSNVVTFLSGNKDFPWLNPDHLDEIDPHGLEGVYDQAWQQIIEHPRRSEIKMIWQWYWNSYWEVCYLEPDSGLGGYAVGDLFVRKTAHYAELFRSGGSFKPYELEPRSLRELKHLVGSINPRELGLSDQSEMDELILGLVSQAQSGVTKRGSLEFNGLRFSTTPAMYEMSADELAVLQTLHGDRLSLEPLGPLAEPAPRRRRAVEPDADTDPIVLGQDV